MMITNDISSNSNYLLLEKENYFIHIYNVIAETVYFYFLNVSNLKMRTIHRSEKHLGTCNNVKRTQAINNYNQ